MCESDGYDHGNFSSQKSLKDNLNQKCISGNKKKKKKEKKKRVNETVNDW